MTVLDDSEDDTGGFDPEAFARRQAHLAEAPRIAVKLEPPEPPAALAWVEEQDAPIKARFEEAVRNLGKRPKATSGPAGRALKLKLAQWQTAWSALRLTMDRELSAVFSSVNRDVYALPGAAYHLQLRANRRATLVAQSTAHLARRKAEEAIAQAEFDQAEAPARAGRELALQNLRTGYANLETALVAETARHARAESEVANMPTHTARLKLQRDAAQEDETARSDAAAAKLTKKLEALETQERYLMARLGITNESD